MRLLSFAATIKYMPYSKVFFGYPEDPSAPLAKIIESIACQIPDEEETGYAGFAEQAQLQQYLESKFSSRKDVTALPVLPEEERVRIAKLIEMYTEKCAQALAVEGAVRVNIFPWLDGARENDFEGTTGYTPYINTIHIYLSPEGFSDTSLIETLCHEYHHAVFMRFHEYSGKLVESMVFEGLADVFRESVVGGRPSPWSIALTENEAEKRISELSPLLDDESFELYEEIFFGSSEYARWTGYSIGYHIVKTYLLGHPQTSWLELTKLPLYDIYIESGFGNP